ncbi:hypothetical protein ACHAXS_005347 [Conticribra weissflogii]
MRGGTLVSTIIFQVIRISHTRAFSSEAGYHIQLVMPARRALHLENEKSYFSLSKHRRTLPRHVWAYSSNPSKETFRRKQVAVNENNSGQQNFPVDKQADTSKYGRGIEHLSADLTEGTDVIAYQDGVWFVDGIEVGDGSANPVVRYAMVDNVQVVWTHDCEHGVIRGFELAVISREDVGEKVGKNELLEGDHGPLVDLGSKFVVTGEYVELGPEQLLARIPTAEVTHGCDMEERETLVALAKFDPDIEIIKGW